MGSLPATWQDNRYYQAHWYRLKNGKIASYRFCGDGAQEKHEKMLRKGAVEIEDPFRKGAPMGGYRGAECRALPQIPRKAK